MFKKLEDAKRFNKQRTGHILKCKYEGEIWRIYKLGEPTFRGDIKALNFISLPPKGTYCVDNVTPIEVIK